MTYMRIVRPLLIGVTVLLSITSIALLVYFSTLQMTILNRNSVKTWADKGGIYQNNLFPMLIHSGTTTSQPQTDNRYGIPNDALKLALERTFTKTYVRNQAETTIDQFYDWLGGKSADFAFTIPINKKRDTFIAEFSRAASPHVAKLPICNLTLAANTPCRPANISPELYAQTIITHSLNQSTFFQKPIALPSVNSSQSSALAPLKATRAVMPYSLAIIIGLILLAIGAAAAHIWLIPANQRLRGLAHLGKRVFFSQVFTFIASLVLILGFATGFLTLPSLPNAPSIVTNTINETLRQAIFDVAGTLALLSGILCFLGIAAWVGILTYRRKKTHVIVDQHQETSDTDPSSSHDDLTPRHL